MPDVRELNHLQLDGLREVANIGAGHAATALSQLTGCRIMVDVPDLRVLKLEEVAELTGQAGEVVAGVLLRVLGDATARAIQVVPGPTAARLAEILLSRECVAFPEGFREMERSALSEVGNILTGAYLNALSEFTGLLLLGSVPAIAIDFAGAILVNSETVASSTNGYVLSIETRFRIHEGNEDLRSHFVLLPDPDSLSILLRAIRLG